MKSTIAVALMFACQHAQKAYADTSEVAASIMLGSDRVWRGLSQTRGNPGIEGEAKWNHADGPVAGLVVADYRSDQTGKSGAAITPFVAFNKDIAGFNIDAGYLYRGVTGARNRDFSEVTISAGHYFGKLRTRLGIFYSWHHYLPGQNTYTYFDTRMPIAEVAGLPLAVTGHLGVFDARGNADDYVDWRVGLTTKVHGVSLSANLSHADVDAERSRLEGARHGGTRFAGTAFLLF